jgi:COP9 signalosome complex subunit 5
VAADDSAGALQIGKSKGKEKEAAKPEKPKEETPLAKAVRDRQVYYSAIPYGIKLSSLLISSRIASEAQHGLISQVLKDVIFSGRPDVTRVDNPVTTAMTT